MNKFLIIQCFDDGAHQGTPFKELSEITSKSLIEYCNLHKYYYAIQSDGLDKTRHSSWSKVFLTRKYLADYDWVWCLDVDTMIMNQNIKLEDIVDENYDVIMTCYQGNIDGLNTGSIIYKNTPWTHELLKEIYDDSKYPIGGPNVFFEQSAIIQYYKNNPDQQHHFKIEHVRKFNSHFHLGMRSLGYNFEYGDFVLHTPGSSNDYRVPAFKKLQDWIIKPGQPIREEFNVEMHG